jgi:hypothetical protein
MRILPSSMNMSQVMMVQMILRDFLKFMAIYLFIAVAFAQALYLLAQNEVRCVLHAHCVPDLRIPSSSCS